MMKMKLALAMVLGSQAYAQVVTYEQVKREIFDTKCFKF